VLYALIAIIIRHIEASFLQRQKNVPLLLAIEESKLAYGINQHCNFFLFSRLPYLFTSTAALYNYCHKFYFKK